MCITVSYGVYTTLIFSTSVYTLELEQHSALLIKVETFDYKGYCFWRQEA